MFDGRDVCYRVITLALEWNHLTGEAALALRSRDTARNARLNYRAYDPYIDYMIFTGIREMPNYRQRMRYYFHIFDGPKVFPDEGGSSLSRPEVAVLQAKALAHELIKAGAFCRSNLILVLDETGNIIFKCWVACNEPRSTSGWQLA